MWRKEYAIERCVFPVLESLRSFPAIGFVYGVFKNVVSLPAVLWDMVDYKRRRGGM